jgi:metal-sulfur cluster biosynthetic enzyme
MNTPPAQSELGLAAAIRAALRAVKYPPYSRDIVSFGVVTDVRIGSGAVAVELTVNSKAPETADRILEDAECVLRALPQLTGLRVTVGLKRGPRSDASIARAGSGPSNPSRGEIPAVGAGFDHDPLLAALARPDLAPDAGYGDDGPLPLDGPLGNRASTRWQGTTPVFQWEIDPSEPERQFYVESEVERGGWIFRTWWQVHPAGLVYASISAMADEDSVVQPQARRHPIGRNVAVNLVYDLRRRGIVAIYGTALDFRPFVEVFLEAFNSHKPESASTTSPVQENRS